MKKQLLAILILITFNVFGQNTSLLGKRSADLEFSRILNYTMDSAKLSDFKPKVVLIDFWATWCAPCLETLPHLEELQNTFSDDLQVITVTHETEERINRFLEKRDVNLPVVIDRDRKLSAQFPHRSIPHTVILDRDGIIRAVTSASEINREVIQKVIDKEEVSLPEKRDVMDFDSSKPLSGNENFIYQITVTPYQEGLPSMANPIGTDGYLNRRILATNLSPKSLYEIAYRFPVGTKTVVEVSDRSALERNKQNVICFDLIVPENMARKRFEIMQQQLDLLYGYDVKVEKRQIPVKVLKLIEGQSPKLTVSEAGERYVTYSGKGLTMKYAKPDVIAEFLEFELNYPVINETGLTGYYDLELPWYHEDPEQIHNELQKIGLELIGDDREIEVLVISDK